MNPIWRDGGFGPVLSDVDGAYVYAFSYFGPDDYASDTEADEFYDGPNVVALDRGDGSVRWRTTLGDSAKVFAPTVVDDDHLYAYRWFDDGPTFHVLDKTDGSEVDTVDAGERADPGDFAVSNGALFQSRRHSVRCFR